MYTIHLIQYNAGQWCWLLIPSLCLSVSSIWCVCVSVYFFFIPLTIQLSSLARQRNVTAVAIVVVMCVFFRCDQDISFRVPVGIFLSMSLLEWPKRRWQTANGCVVSSNHMECVLATEWMYLNFTYSHRHAHSHSHTYTHNSYHNNEIKYLYDGQCDVINSKWKLSNIAPFFIWFLLFSCVIRRTILLLLLLFSAFM